MTTLAANIKVDQDLFLRRFSAWTRSIEPGDFVIFYFAGHGVGISNANYLVPADMPDFTDADEYTFRAHAIAESEIRDRIKESGARVAVLMLDACRNNPFASNGRGIAFSRSYSPRYVTPAFCGWRAPSRASEFGRHGAPSVDALMGMRRLRDGLVLV